MTLRNFLWFTLICSICPLSRAEVAAPPFLEKWIQHAAVLKTAKIKFTQNRFLRSVHKPLVSSGEVSFQSPGLIRMVSGDPPKMIATLDKSGNLTVQTPAKKEAEVLSPQALEEMAGGQGIALLQGGFPKSVADWKKQFEIIEIAKPENGVSKVSTKLAGKVNPVILKIDFLIKEDNGALQAIHFHFRDGSRIENQFSEMTENPSLPASTFVPDLTGYEVKNK